ncbi:hypothetical protein CDL12_03253 [Handroanthus impetiginosus]|uniref:Uncharacterized protein n=1 Tax=Handroanthus impetiginosus TaxID=429701 RepID=A0A2G9I329_9LAMI|nr:hypothetical protein CDL12_03253 [Handroanthus impetiginosus]
MINGDKILPFPMDTHSRRDREKTKQNQKNNYNMNTRGEALDQNTFARTKIKHNYQSSYGEEMVQLTGSDEMGKQQFSSRKQKWTFPNPYKPKKSKESWVQSQVGYKLGQVKFSKAKGEEACKGGNGELCL